MLKHGVQAKICRSKSFLSRENRLELYFCPRQILKKPKLLEIMLYSRKKKKIELFSERRAIVHLFTQLCKKLAQVYWTTCQTGGQRLIFWGLIKKFGKRKLISVEDRVNSTVYFGVLASNLLPHITYLGENLRQDDTPAHTSAETQTWFLKLLSRFWKNGLPFRRISILSDNLWSILKNKVAKRQPKNVDDLGKFVWKNFMPSQSFMSENFSNW